MPCDRLHPVFRVPRVVILVQDLERRSVGVPKRDALSSQLFGQIFRLSHESEILRSRLLDVAASKRFRNLKIPQRKIGGGKKMERLRDGDRTFRALLFAFAATQRIQELSE